MIRRVKEVTYDLQLVEDSSILTVFHVSQLWHVLTPAVSASSELPAASDVANFPMKILEKRCSRNIHELGLVRLYGDLVTPDTWPHGRTSTISGIIPQLHRLTPRKRKESAT